MLAIFCCNEMNLIAYDVEIWCDIAPIDDHMNLSCESYAFTTSSELLPRNLGFPRSRRRRTFVTGHLIDHHVGHPSTEKTERDDVDEIRGNDLCNMKMIWIWNIKPMWKIKSKWNAYDNIKSISNEYEIETNIKVKHLLPQILQPSSVASLGHHPAATGEFWSDFGSQPILIFYQNKNTTFLIFVRFTEFFVFQGRSVHIHPFPFLFTGSKFWGQSEPPIPTWVWPLERMVCGCQGFVVDGGCYNPPWSGQWNVPPMSKVFNIGSSSRMKTKEIVLVYKIPDFWIKNDLFHVSTFVKSPFSTDCFRAPCQECFSESSLAAQTKPPVFSVRLIQDIVLALPCS